MQTGKITLKYLAHVQTETEFIRAYKSEIERLFDEIETYLKLHGFKKDKYEQMYGQRLNDLYKGLSDDRFSPEVMHALAMLYHKRLREFSMATEKYIKHTFDDYDEIVNEYNRVKHHLDV